MKLLVASMVTVTVLSMGIFIGAFQACTNSTDVVEDAVADIDTATDNTQLGDATNTVNILDVDILDVVPTEELVDAVVDVEVLVFTEDETQDVLYSDVE